MGKRLTIELPDEAYDALRTAAKSSGASTEAEATDRLLRSLEGTPARVNRADEALIRAGLLLSIPDYSKATPPAQRFVARPVKGKPVSETIIEERR